MNKSDDPAQNGIQVCSICGAEMPSNASRCDSCGATQGKRQKCQFCKIIAEPITHDELRLVCPSCGAPRLPVIDGVEPTQAMTEALCTARSARSSQSIWRVAAGLSGVFGLFALALLLGVWLIASPGWLPMIAAGLVVLAPIVFSVLAFVNAGKRGRQAHESLRSAWLEAAKEYTTAEGTVRAPQLAAALNINESMATKLVSELASRSDVTTNVTEEGELAICMGTPNRMRVASPREREEVEAEVSNESGAGRERA